MATQHCYFIAFGKNIPVFKMQGQIQKFALTQKDIDHGRSVDLNDKFKDPNNERYIE